MKMGVSTKAFPLRYWDNELLKYNYRTIEICSTTNILPKKEVGREAIKENLKNFDLSLHSSNHLFNKNRLVAGAEIANFRYHSFLAKELGAKEVIFHVSSEFDIDVFKKQEHEFRNIINEYGREYYIENNSGGLFSSHEEILWFCRRFPEIKICLDIGHIHRAFFRGAIKGEEKTIFEMKNKINYVHLHDNNGLKDEHLACGSGNIEWEKVIPILNEINPKKAIIEVNNPKDVEISKTFLMENGLKIECYK